jgi:predicted NUDIX family NTP pyrophosphohydrolase
VAVRWSRSAGLLLFQVVDGVLEVLIGHMGGPLWAHKDDRGWSIPKGEYGPDEDPRAAAAREFAEEVGSVAPAGTWIELGEARQPNGKIVTIFALSGSFDPATAVSNLFEMEWPRGSGRIQSFPEIDRVAWLDLPTARAKLLQGQVVFLDRLAAALTGHDGGPSA